MSWHSKGLRFKCTGCGKCCTGSPGYIWVSDEEIVQISKHLNLSIEQFAERYLRKINGRFSLKETYPHYDCIFLKEKKCEIYEVRPSQCRTFPFWPQNISSEEAWNELGKLCEGINHPEGELIQLGAKT